MDPLKLQKSLIQLLESATDNTLNASEARGELDDLDIKLDLHQVRAGLEQLVTLGRAIKPKVAPGAAVAYQLVAFGEATPIAPAAMPPPPPADDNVHESQILAAIPREQPLGIRSIVRTTKLSRPVVVRVLRDLYNAGKVERHGKARATVYAHAGTQVSRETPAPPPPPEPAARKAKAKTRVAKAHRKAWVTKPAAKEKERNGKQPGNLRGAFSELRTKLSTIGAIAVHDLKRKVATLEQLAQLVPPPIAAVLAEIRQDLQGRA